MIMAVGGLIVMWPQAERRRRQGGYVAVMAPEGARAAVSAEGTLVTASERA
jgi:hypothetical protein